MYKNPLNEHTLGKAISFASNVHKCQLDLAGKSYILHPLRVMNRVINLGDKYAIVAVCHDVIEDSHSPKETLNSFKELVTDDFEVITSLDLLTKKKGSSYEEYIIRLSKFYIAREVKVADLIDNCDIIRLDSIEDSSTLERLKKYHAAYNFLT